MAQKTRRSVFRPRPSSGARNTGSSNRRRFCAPIAALLAFLTFLPPAQAGSFCAQWDGPVILDGALACAEPVAASCSDPRIRDGALVCREGDDGAGREALRELAASAAKRHGVPERLFLALVANESAWATDARSPAGAVGLAQLMPVTARELSVDPLDPAQNLDGGARYLKRQFLAFGSWELALAAYNAGPKAVEKHRGVPPFAETARYVARVLADAGMS